MVQRYHEEVDPHKAFVCGQQQANSDSSMVEAKAQYIHGWEHKWDRLTSEDSLRSQSCPTDETSPRWDSRVTEGGPVDRGAYRDGTGRSLHASYRSRSSLNGVRRRSSHSDGAGSHQSCDSSRGPAGSLQVEDGSQEAVSARKYCGLLPRRSNSA